MQTESFDVKKALQLTRIIYFSIIGGMMFFLVIVFSIANETFFFSADLTEILFALLLFLSIIAIPGSYFFSAKAIKALNINDTISKKFTVYQSALITRMAGCEGVGLFAIVCLLLTSNLFSMVFLIVPLAAMVSYYPQAEKIAKEINLSHSETELFK